MTKQRNPLSRCRATCASLRLTGTSLSTSIALAASSLAAVMILILGGVSYYVMHSQVSDAIGSSLRFDATVLAGHVSSDLNAITSTLKALSRNTVLTNALMDSTVRNTYLGPFLRDFHRVNGIPVEITLTDFEGNPIAGSPRLSLRQLDWGQRVLEEGVTHARIEQGEDGKEAITIAEPIFYFRTPSPEGALVYRISLEHLRHDVLHGITQDLDHIPTMRLLHAGRFTELSISSPTQRSASSSREQVDDRIVERRHVSVDPSLENLSLEVEVGIDEEQFEEPLQDLVIAYSLVGAASVSLIVLVSWMAGSYLLRPLRNLESVACAVVQSGSLDHRVSSDGPLEIKRLGAAFNQMLKRLAKAHRDLEQLAQFDTLTGLANRAVFGERLEVAMANARRTNGLLAILLLDVDHFKEVNDIFGHPAGDALLRQVATRLVEHVRDTDTVARLGGDEFAIIATNLSRPEDAGALASKIRASLLNPVHVESQSLSVTTSIGITLFPNDEQNAVQLLKSADLALYHVKTEGRNGYQFYNVAMNQKVQKRRRLENTIRETLESGRFQLWFQPKLNILSGATVVGVEALLRLPSELGIESPPAQLIDVAESTGLIKAVGEWVLREACFQVRNWSQNGLPLIPVAVNLSAIQLRHGNLVKEVSEILRDTRLPPSNLELEITESAMMERVETVTDTLTRIHDLGVRLAIDDFGTGYSSMTYLKRFPVDTLKIDASFVDGVAASGDDAAIARAIIALAQSLNLNVVAEGVETNAQLSFLRIHGCQQAQGYFFAPPMSSNDFVTWWHERLEKPRILENADLHLDSFARESPMAEHRQYLLPTGN